MLFVQKYFSQLTRANNLIPRLAETKKKPKTFLRALFSHIT